MTQRLQMRNWKRAYNCAKNEYDESVILTVARALVEKHK